LCNWYSMKREFNWKWPVKITQGKVVNIAFGIVTNSIGDSFGTLTQVLAIPLTGSIKECIGERGDTFAVIFGQYLIPILINGVLKQSHRIFKVCYRVSSFEVSVVIWSAQPLTITLITATRSLQAWWTLTSLHAGTASVCSQPTSRAQCYCSTRRHCPDEAAHTVFYVPVLPMNLINLLHLSKKHAVATQLHCVKNRTNFETV